MIEELIKPKLDALGLSQTEFSELLIRLLDYGVINRDESNIEAQFYDRYLMCAELVEDYLRIIGIRLYHDRQFFYLRAFPPGAEVPGLPDDDNSISSLGMRFRPSQQDVAVILVLRMEYEKSLREGKVDDKGCAMLSFEGLVFAMKNLLKRSLPENLSERKAIFKRLRQLRLVQYSHEEDLETEEYWLSIQPSITSFVNGEALEELYPSAPSTMSDTASADVQDDNQYENQKDSKNLSPIKPEAGTSEANNVL